MFSFFKKTTFGLPFLIIAGLLMLLWYELFHQHPTELPSNLIGEPLPHFELTNLYFPQQVFKPDDLKGQMSLLTVWASWCDACASEAPMLMKLKNELHIKLYSINYKDDPQAAKAWLAKYGNPFLITGSDTTGDAAIDLGVYGTPETFVISASGKILYRQIGPITEAIWREKIAPLMTQYAPKQA